MDIGTVILTKLQVEGVQTVHVCIDLHSPFLNTLVARNCACKMPVNA